mgnify:CR=1 FL=1
MNGNSAETSDCNESAPASFAGAPGSAVIAVGIRARRRDAKLYAAMKLEHLICDGAFDDLVKPYIWKIVEKLRAQRGSRRTEGKR